MDRGELEALNAASIVHLIRGDYISAMATSMDACAFARRVDDPLLRAHASVSLHLSAFNLDAREEAAHGLRACVQAGVEAGDAGLEIRARVALGVVLGDSAQFDAAAFELQRALSMAHGDFPVPCPARITTSLANLHRKRAMADVRSGSNARARAECDEAIRLARRACELAAPWGSLGVEIDAVAILGCAHAIAGDARRGRAMLMESAALGRGARSRTSIVWVLCQLGSVMLAQGELAGARSTYLEALEIATELRPTLKSAVACEGLAEAALARGDGDDFRRWRDRAVAERADFERARRRARQQVDAVLLAA